MRKLRVVALCILFVYAFFSVLALVDGVYHLARSDVELFLYAGSAASIVGFIALLVMKPDHHESGIFKDNVLSLWIKRKKLEEEKRIKELQDK
ncbi:hypothetical protein QPB07_001384 [Salmonella enterica subsp. enterica serovar Minnesota]|nr:hypothetical protein [Salmonella enterica]EDH7438450.1 hypothetical protein [Salmonella enterica subsp. enterica]EIS8673214.1 hypothetical protein [Salmonella enterica subsp. enterica serovar Minnesota]EAX0158117.1 hypothetical protein [Salmonella enterica]EHJ8929181.1 hypothetical protein [Salmonella enterica]